MDDPFWIVSEGGGRRREGIAGRGSRGGFDVGFLFEFGFVSFVVVVVVDVVVDVVFSVAVSTMNILWRWGKSFVGIPPVISEEDSFGDSSSFSLIFSLSLPPPLPPSLSLSLPLSAILPGFFRDSFEIFSRCFEIL